MHHPNRSLVRRFWGAALGLAVTLSAAAQTTSLPQHGSDSHLGVVTCAGSTCHGATRPFQNATVMQNEFVIWHRDDKHAKAYNVLLNERSKRIARNLGLEAAHSARICLDCHADNVPKELQGKRFQLSDGVGCEACHGGAKRFLGPHVSGENSRQDNLDAGMYPTERPEGRAKLCLSCHLGTADKFATHRIMGAGHPRLSFELDTFTEIQPAHYKVDADYRKRKEVWSGVQVWAIGQLLAVEQSLDLLTSSKYQNTGPWPELAFYDCHACHHPMSNRRWRPHELSRGLGPGVVRLNDANFLILYEIAARIAPELGGRFKSAVQGLHQATLKDQSSVRAAAQGVRAVAGDLRGRVLQHAFSAADMKAILATIVAKGEAGEYSDYGAAEQGVMAIATLKGVLEKTGSLSAAETRALSQALGRLYAALKDPDRYRPEWLQATLRTLGGTLQGS